VPFAPEKDGFVRLVEGLRGGVIRGLNVTLPFKAEALAAATHSSPRAQAAGAANVLLFQPGGAIIADNTDGAGMMAAFAEQAPGFDPQSGPVVVLGAGGAAQGACATLVAEGAPEVRIVNRTLSRAETLAKQIHPSCEAYPLEAIGEAMVGAQALVNASSAALEGETAPDVPLELLPPHAVVMDMVYVPLETPILRAAKARGLRTVDGLAMLIGQARPSFEMFFGQHPPPVDVRALAIAALSGRT
jgi:shikimate dehydrogenase